MPRFFEDAANCFLEMAYVDMFCAGVGLSTTYGISICVWFLALCRVVAKKRSWGTLTNAWVPHDVRDVIVDYVTRWSERTEIPVQRFVSWLGVAASKFYDWRARYGLANEHNALVPRDWWLEDWEKKAILDFHA